MKEILAVISVVVIAVVGEPPAPYAPSGWRPKGPAFQLPQETSQTSQQSYLPPRIQNQYGVPDEGDLAVQGLPVKEQSPIFLVSPINGQQYVGINFNGDIRNLDERLRESQFQTQQDVFRQIARDRQQYGAPNTRQDPRQLAKETTSYPAVTESTTFTTTSNEFDNREVTEVNDNDENSIKTATKGGNQSQRSQNVLAVEITKENIKELPVILLGSLNQYNSQSYPIPNQDKGALFLPQNGLQLAKLSQPQVGYNAPTHLAGLQSILYQRQLLAAQHPQSFTPNQQAAAQNPHMFLANTNQEVGTNKDVEQFSQNEQNFGQYTPMVQQQPQAAFFPQVQSVLLQNQPQYLFPPAQVQLPSNQYGQPLSNQPESTDDDDNKERNYPNQPQFVINPPQTYQPQEVQYPVNEQVLQTQNIQNQQAFITQPQVKYQPQDFQQNQLLLNQPQYVNYQPVLNQDLSQFYQNQAFLQQQQVQQQVYQNGLQEGLDKNQGGNGLEQDKEDDDDDDSNEETDPSVSAVATAFGTRTSPRVYTQYGLPGSRPTSTPERETVTEAMDSSTDDTPAIAQATAVARGSRRRNSKLRVRRVRPVFTLDKSGHLVLLNNQ